MKNRFERLSPGDHTTLVTDRGPVPMNIAAALVLEGAGSWDLGAVVGLLGERLLVVPRLRQRLLRTPIGCGRPVWVDDAAFSTDRHLSARTAASDSELLEIVADLACTPLHRDRPLWRACLVTGLPEDRGALVLVMHHVMADGLGGLAVLAALADDPAPKIRARARPSVGTVPRPVPDFPALALDAAQERLASLQRAPATLIRSVAGLRELGLSSRPRLAAATSLNRPTGSRRTLTVATAPLHDVVAAAHQAGGTVNDVVLAAVVGALAATLARRGEHPAHLVVSVPVSARQAADAVHLGNQVGVRPVVVPTLGDDRARLAAVIRSTRAAAKTTRASSATPIGGAFRAFARLGMFQTFIDHQRLVHTFETNLRGPVAPLYLGGCRVSRIIPAAVTPGNVGVSFDVLSYAGDLAVTIVADPVLLPEQDALTAALAAALETLLVAPRRCRVDLGRRTLLVRASTDPGRSVVTGVRRDGDVERLFMQRPAPPKRSGPLTC